MLLCWAAPRGRLGPHRFGVRCLPLGWCRTRAQGSLTVPLACTRPDLHPAPPRLELHPYSSRTAPRSRLGGRGGLPWEAEASLGSRSGGPLPTSPSCSARREAPLSVVNDGARGCEAARCVADGPSRPVEAATRAICAERRARSKSHSAVARPPRRRPQRRGTAARDAVGAPPESKPWARAAAKVDLI